MRITRIIVTIAVIGFAVLALGEGLVKFYGSGNLTMLLPGAVYFNTSNSTFWVGSPSSNPVMVGNAAWSNNVTASVTNGLASTNFVNAAIADRPITNAWNTSYYIITNTPPTGTNLVLWTDDGTNLAWKAWP